ncbi:hypothetical protein M0R89_03100 [Halorussus limi]|uniref:Uncharacterized protein n=1 Tax=Halorussus limi TaxID=2938695 RepID=A0A8U0HWC5_9EURY|nr:hypothetical protein [Halorussus limi]UPV75063.1 hypothetical protein M0R89_03100 [Halorussus limi]
MTRPSPSRTRFDVTLVARIFVSLLFLVSLAAAVGTVWSGDSDSLTTVAGSLYVTGALAVGVFLDVTDTPRWQAAFFGGMVVFGLAEYAASPDWFDLLLVAAGAAMLVALALDARSG